MRPREKKAKKEVINRVKRGKADNRKIRVEKPSLEMEPRKSDYCWEISCAKLLLIMDMSPKI